VLFARRRDAGVEIDPDALIVAAVVGAARAGASFVDRACAVIGHADASAVFARQQVRVQDVVGDVALGEVLGRQRDVERAAAGAAQGDAGGAVDVVAADGVLVAEDGEVNGPAFARGIDPGGELAKRRWDLSAEDQRVEEPLEARCEVGMIVARGEGHGERVKLGDQVGRNRRQIATLWGWR